MDACVVSGYLIIYNKKNRHMEQEERMYQVLLEMICRHDRTAEVCRAAVEEDGWQLKNVPEEVKTPNCAGRHWKRKRDSGTTASG